MRACVLSATIPAGSVLIIDDSSAPGERTVESPRITRQNTGGNKVSGEKSQNLQDVFLNHVRKNKLAVTIFLVNGVKLQGVITWFDNFCVLLRRDNHSQLVYKHAISTVMPGQPIQLFEQNKEEAEET